MASKIKPGTGLTTKLATDVPERNYFRVGVMSLVDIADEIIFRFRFRFRVTKLFTKLVDLKCLDPAIFPVTYTSTFLLTAVAVFSDQNIDGCCDDHGVPLFVLSLLGSHDSVSLCVVLLNKIRFVYDFVIIQM